jgi:hypothetical protein
MNILREDKDRFAEDGLDGLIRWALHDSVADAEPSPLVWERIQQRILDERETTTPSLPRRRIWSRSMWLGWLVGAGANCPVPGDPRLAWQRRLHAFDMRGSMSIVRIVEGGMPVLRLVS